MESLNEETTKLRYITPAITHAGWNLEQIVCENYFFTKPQVVIEDGIGKRVGEGKKTDYELCYLDENQPLAVVEAKEYQKPVGHGMQQAIDYAVALDVDFAYSTNGHEFLEHDLTTGREKKIPLDEFPSPEELWQRHCVAHGLEMEVSKEVQTPYYYGYDSMSPRYYQRIAINRTVEAIAKGQNRILLVMATGTGKTYTAFQIVWRLREAGLKKKILYLADRNILLDQTISGDFKPLSSVTTKVKGRNLDPAYEVFFSSYQQLINDNPEDPDAPQPFEQLDSSFFDLVIVDECHRGSASADSSWRRILDYFSSATQIGMTATPKETKAVSTSEYFGDPIYSYTLKQGIEDGFLAPYRVCRIHLDIDDFGFVPAEGQLDDYGQPIEVREYVQADIDRNIVFTQRDLIVARRITEYLKSTDRFQKTIVFCVDIDHAERLRQALVNENADVMKEHPNYIQRCTGDIHGVEALLDHFMDVDETFPTVLTTSKLLTTGVNCKTCKVIVLDNTFGEQGMTEFKQIVGRGTRIKEDREKLYFTVLDFRDASRMFMDPDFDGTPPIIDLPGSPKQPGEPKGPVLVDPPAPPEPPTPHIKYFVSDVPVEVLGEQVQYYWGGTLHTESLVEYSRKNVHEQFHTLDDFINKWNSQEKKAAIREELEKQGVFLEQLREQCGRDDLDDFDLICHIAFDVKPLTRKERAEGVRKKGYLYQYSDAAQQVLDTLLEKYSNSDIRDLDDMEILQLKEFQSIGSVSKIVGFFGGKEQFLKAAQALENELYHVAA